VRLAVVCQDDRENDGGGYAYREDTAPDRSGRDCLGGACSVSKADGEQWDDSVAATFFWDAVLAFGLLDVPLPGEIVEVLVHPHVERVADFTPEGLGVR
jgi:hypothetical protein